MRYRPEIDGLRTVAVLPVLAFHAGFSTFSRGFVGVDVFFVISGFLITRQIVEDIEAGTFSFLQFYERRARRLAPALLLVLLVTCLAAVFILLPADLARFSESQISTLFSISNIYFRLDTGYFATAADSKPLLHTWSLAVEEQFYLIFPILLILAHRLRCPLLGLCLGLVMVSFALAMFATPRMASASFYLLTTRLWELAAGAVSAFFVRNSSEYQLPRTALTGLGLGMILWAVFQFDKVTPMPALPTTLLVLGTVLILLFGHHKGNLIGALLSPPVFVGIGLISYSLYLWHQPIFVFARLMHVGELPAIASVGMIVLALILAFLSWHYIERPFRGSRPRVLPDRRRFFAGLATCTNNVGPCNLRRGRMEHRWLCGSV